MFLNLDEDGFGYGLWHFLHKQFLEPYRYERADAGLPVPPSSPLLRCVRLQPVRPAPPIRCISEVGGWIRLAVVRIPF